MRVGWGGGGGGGGGGLDVRIVSGQVTVQRNIGMGKFYGCN